MTILGREALRTIIVIPLKHDTILGYYPFYFCSKVLNVVSSCNRKRMPRRIVRQTLGVHFSLSIVFVRRVTDISSIFSNIRRKQSRNAFTSFYQYEMCNGRKYECVKTFGLTLERTSGFFELQTNLNV